MNILLIEDSSAEAILLEKYITKIGNNISITKASDLHSAYKLYKENSYKLIILDLNLPDGYGPNSIDEVKRFNLNTPIIATSGLMVELTEQISKKKGAVAVFSKKQIYCGEADETILQYLKN